MSNVANCNISRTMPNSVSVSKSNVSICVGNTYKLNAEVLPLKTSQSVNWSSSNTSVATVDVDGTVTAKKAGTVTITAKSSLDSSKEASCTVKVVPKIYMTDELQKLYLLAKSYKALYGSTSTCDELVVQFIRRKIYPLEHDKENNIIRWEIAAGEVDYDFVNYVKRNNIDLYNTLTIENAYMINNNADSIDFVHLMATLNVYLYDTTKLSATEQIIDELGGWGGDLRSLVSDVITATNNSDSFSKCYRAARELIGADMNDEELCSANPSSGFSVGKTHFSLQDLNADVDAYNIYCMILETNSPIYVVYENYYTTSSKDRFSIFINNLSDAGIDIFEEAREIISNDNTILRFAWPVDYYFETQIDAISQAFGTNIYEAAENKISLPFKW